MQRNEKIVCVVCVCYAYSFCSRQDLFVYRDSQAGGLEICQTNLGYLPVFFRFMCKKLTEH
jgi:hypothetical protein